MTLRCAGSQVGTPPGGSWGFGFGGGLVRRRFLPPHRAKRERASVFVSKNGNGKDDENEGTRNG